MPDLLSAGNAFVNLDTGEPLAPDAPLVTANAYLGARPIADALDAGAQVVVTGRVTDASLTVGPALHAFGWADEDYDAIAGAVVAGHVIECGAQCCGGNYAFFEEIPGASRIGFPLAELYPDGSSVITKHPGTGGALTVGTVTAQLLYEIAGPRYLSPDAVARFDTMAVEQVGPDRVRISGVEGEPPPSTLKVTANLDAGWRNSMTLAITGAQVEEKAARGRGGGVGGHSRGSRRVRRDVRGPLRRPQRRRAWRSCGSPCAGTTGMRWVGASRERWSRRAWPATRVPSSPRRRVTPRRWPATGRRPSPPEPSRRASSARGNRSPPPRGRPGRRGSPIRRRPVAPPPAARPAHDGATAEDLIAVPLWVLIGGRSGDKGGDANVGLWADTEPVARWLCDSFDVEQFKEALPESAPFEVSRHPLPNLRAVNFVVHGILGWGVASNLRLDTQAKGMAERLRSHSVMVPSHLVSSGPPAARWSSRQT